MPALLFTECNHGSGVQNCFSVFFRSSFQCPESYAGGLRSKKSDLIWMGLRIQQGLHCNSSREGRGQLRNIPAGSPRPFGAHSCLRPRSQRTKHTSQCSLLSAKPKKVASSFRLRKLSSRAALLGAPRIQIHTSSPRTLVSSANSHLQRRTGDRGQR